MKRRLALAATVWMLAVPSAAFSQTASTAGPRGWDTAVQGKAVVAAPRNLAPGELFFIGIESGLEAQGRSLRGWFQQTIESKSRMLGTLVKEEGIQTRKTGELVAERRYKMADGKSVLASFILKPRQDGSYGLIMIACTEKACNAHLAAAKEWMEAFAAGRIAPRTTGDVGGAPAETRPAEKPAETRPAEKPEPRPEYQTEPGRGLKPSEVDRVATHFEMSALSGASMDVILLLKNGEYCTNLNVPPSDMDVAAHKKRFPGHWGKWRRRGDKIQRLSDGRWIDTEWSGSLRPARPGEKLKGVFQRITGASGVVGSTTVVSSSSITFLPDGRFRYGSFGGVWTAGAGSGPATTHASSSRERQGTYRLEDRTIEFRFSDGTVDRRAFHWVNDKDKDSIFLNSTFYFIDD